MRRETGQIGVIPCSAGQHARERQGNRTCRVVEHRKPNHSSFRGLSGRSWQCAVIPPAFAAPSCWSVAPWTDAVIRWALPLRICCVPVVSRWPDSLLLLEGEVGQRARRKNSTFTRVLPPSADPSDPSCYPTHNRTQSSASPLSTFRSPYYVATVPAWYHRNTRSLIETA